MKITILNVGLSTHNSTQFQLKHSAQIINCCPTKSQQRPNFAFIQILILLLYT